MPFLGDRFRAAREARGLSLADVSEHIHIRAIYLDCIEREDWAAVGAPVYTRGFVRTYARYIGLEPDQAVAEYAQSSGTPAGTPTATLGGSSVAPRQVATPRELSTRELVPPPRDLGNGRDSARSDDYDSGRRSEPQRKPPPIRKPPPSTPPPAPRPSAQRPPTPKPRQTKGDGPSLIVYIFGFIAIALVGAVGYTIYVNATGGQSKGGDPNSQTQATSAPVARATAGPAHPTPAPERTLAFEVTAKSWVQIEMDGGAPVAATLDKGTTKVFHGKTAVLRVGNAGGVIVTVDGKTIGPLGAPGAVVQRTFTL